jgi:flagellar assembly factor FliW
MIIHTSRFGTLEAEESRLIHFPSGILGFPRNREYALIQTGDDSAFYWLQAVNQPELAFVVCDPRLFAPEYSVHVKTEDLRAIGLDDISGVQVFIIVNKIGGMLTGNMQGPLIINVVTRVARQLVLSERYATRHPLMSLVRETLATSRTA